jgi:hypothetical protein
MMEHVINTIDTVTIHKDDYADLLITAENYSRILNAVFLSASLSWDKRGLAFDYSVMDMTLRIIEPERHRAVLKRLQDEKAEKEKAEREKAEREESENATNYD